VFTLSFLVGFLGSLFGGLVGLGGGVIMIPLMVSLLKLNQHSAHGTSLVAVVFTGLSGAIVYSSKGNVDVMAAILLAATAMLTARMGVHYAHALPEWKLKRSFGAFLVFVSLLLPLKPYLPMMQGLETGWLKVAVLLVTGAFTGFLSGMMGVGGGTILVPAMVLLTGFSQHIAQGSSLLAMVPASSVGAYSHWKLGNVKTTALWGMIPGVLVGTYLGGTTAQFLREDILRIVFSVVLIWIGVRYLRAKRPAPKPESSNPSA